MRKWAGRFACGSLPDQVRKDLRRRIKKILTDHGVPFADTKELVRELTDEVSFAYAGRGHTLEQVGAGRPTKAPEMLLAARVADILNAYGVRGNWLDSSWAGQTGPVTRLEAAAQTALRQACGGAMGVMARPASISDARRLLGKVYVNDPLPKSSHNN
jgi:hypothetical protein